MAADARSEVRIISQTYACPAPLRSRVRQLCDRQAPGEMESCYFAFSPRDMSAPRPRGSLSRRSCGTCTRPDEKRPGIAAGPPSRSTFRSLVPGERNRAADRFRRHANLGRGAPGVAFSVAGPGSSALAGSRHSRARRPAPARGDRSPHAPSLAVGSVRNASLCSAAVPAFHRPTQFAFPEGIAALHVRSRLPPDRSTTGESGLRLGLPSTSASPLRTDPKTGSASTFGSAA